MFARFSVCDAGVGSFPRLWSTSLYGCTGVVDPFPLMGPLSYFRGGGSGYESVAGNTCAEGGDGGQDAPFSWMGAREWMCPGHREGAPLSFPESCLY